VSDGWIGDQAHAATQSEHNPDAHGIVHAIDLTAEGIDPWIVSIAAIVHPSTWYVIYRKRIFSRTHNFVGREYLGADPHDSHIHVSILLTAAARQNNRRWI